MDLAAIITGSVKDGLNLVQGVVGRKDDELYVAIDGSVIATTWLDNVTVDAGDKVLVLITQPKTGPGTAIVVGRLTDKPRQLYGKVAQVPATGSTIKVDVAGTVFDAVWTTDKPPVGTIVALLWQGATPVIIGKRGEAAKTSDVDVAKPSTPETTKEIYVKAVDSGTYNVSRGLWSQYYKSSVYVGSWQSTKTTGVWFYGGGLAQLAAVKQLQMFLPARHKAGYYGRTANVVLDLVSQGSKTGSPQFLGLDFSVSVASGWAGGWITLPSSWIGRLGSAGGIGIKSGDYAGFTGVYDSAASGQLWGK